MYINITPQKLGTNYSQSSADFVDYLEKENQGLEKEEMEHFFNQYGDEISAKEVVKEIDGNTAKLKKERLKKHGDQYGRKGSPAKNQSQQTIKNKVG